MEAAVARCVPPHSSLLNGGRIGLTGAGNWLRTAASQAARRTRGLELAGAGRKRLAEPSGLDEVVEATQQTS